MSLPFIQTSFSAGEISPHLLGREDLQKFHIGATTMRNFYVDYRGGASSRAGFAYVGMCKQGAPNVGGTSTINPPRDIKFQFNINQGYALEFGDRYMRIKTNGGYVLENAIGVSVDTAGKFTSSINHQFSIGDWIYITGNGDYDSLVWVVYSVPSATTFYVQDLFGNNTNLNVASSGTMARIYTVTSPYDAIDLPYLKFTQSADTMTLCCINSTTQKEYPPYNLIRNGANNWVFNPISFTTSAIKPSGVAVTANSYIAYNGSATPANTTWYSYVVTSVDSNTGEESIASNPCFVYNYDIAVYAGSNTITWNGIATASYYNIYSAPASASAPVPAGAMYSLIGSSYGNTFTDGNIASNGNITPPIHNNPFALSGILVVNVVNQGSGYTQNTVGYTINTSMGSGFDGSPVIINGKLSSFVVKSSGQNYSSNDTITITGGTGATVSIQLGKTFGVYPAVPAYFQQRKVYANTINNPDTFWMSKTGLFNNFDISQITVDNDSISGTPWSQQINGIQHMVSMPSGLIVLTGNGAWQLAGVNNGAITPASISASPQAFNGISQIVPPLQINYDILYVQAKGSIVRDLSYNFFVNIYTGTDMTVLSNHLFDNHLIKNWAYCEEPYKIIWSTRDDGIILSFTYLKEQDVYGWARHDTNGLFISTCSVIEPPVDSLYVIVKRYIRNKWVYYAERMNNRLWNGVEDVFCVDSGLSVAITYLNATLSFSVSSDNVTVIITASNPVFTPTYLTQILRASGGVIILTNYNSSTSMTGTITSPFTKYIPNSTTNQIMPAITGQWFILPLLKTIKKLNHLEGMEVSVLADGNVVSPNPIVTNGQIKLANSASYVTIGLPYTCQLQTPYLSPQNSPASGQGKRKTIASVTVRLAETRGITIGTNQPDASMQPYGADITWTNMTEWKQRSSSLQINQVVPLYTGDASIAVNSGFDTNGQIAMQQSYPLPCNVLAVIPIYTLGDTSSGTQ